MNNNKIYNYYLVLNIPYFVYKKALNIKLKCRCKEYKDIFTLLINFLHNEEEY